MSVLTKLQLTGFLIIFSAQSGLLHAETDSLGSAVESGVQAQKEAVESQQKIEKIAHDTRDMGQRYRDTIRQTDNLKTYNEQLSKLIKQQKTSLRSIQRQLDNVEGTQQSIVPLMLKMIQTLQKFVELDLPFLKEERQQRIAGLTETMDRPDYSLPDKYRRIMEAYQIEMEYGRTIETYTDTITLNAKEYTVDVLRVGRLLMAFQTLDGKLSGSWNRDKNNWDELAPEYSRSINQALQIAKKQAPPELVKLPVQAAGEKP